MLDEYHKAIEVAEAVVAWVEELVFAAYPE